MAHEVGFDSKQGATPRLGCPVGTVYHVVLGEVLTAVVIRGEPCLGSHDDVGVGDFQESEKFFLFVSDAAEVYIHSTDRVCILGYGTGWGGCGW